MPAPPPEYQQIIRFLHRDLSVSSFEQWVYENPGLESVFGRGEYHQLLSFDYRQLHALHELQQLVEGIYQRSRPGMLIRDRVWWLACTLATDDDSIFMRGVDGLAALWYEGHSWISTAFVAISSEMDDIPHSDEYPLQEQNVAEVKRLEWQNRLDEQRRAAKGAALALLEREFPDAPCA